MKLLLLSLMILLCVLPCSAVQAQSAPLATFAIKPLKDSKANNVIIVNGKKFFSLQNARRFTGSTSSPGALMVIHHPRSPETIITHRATLAPAVSGSANTPATSSVQPSEVLSVFAPDEKGAPAPPSVSAPTK